MKDQSKELNQIFTDVILTSGYKTLTDLFDNKINYKDIEFISDGMLDYYFEERIKSDTYLVKYEIKYHNQSYLVSFEEERYRDDSSYNYEGVELLTNRRCTACGK